MISLKCKNNLNRWIEVFNQGKSIKLGSSKIKQTIIDSNGYIDISEIVAPTNVSGCFIYFRGGNNNDCDFCFIWIGDKIFAQSIINTGTRDQSPMGMNLYTINSAPEKWLVDETENKVFQGKTVFLTYCVW